MTAAEFMSHVFNQIEHGDEGHRKWLKDKCDELVPKLERSFKEASAASITVMQHMNDKIDHMLKRPQMYGDQEAVQFQIIQAMEVIALIIDPKWVETRPRIVIEKFQKFIEKRYGETNHYLCHMNLTDEEFILRMSQFREGFSLYT